MSEKEVPEMFQKATEASPAIAFSMRVLPAGAPQQGFYCLVLACFHRHV